MKITNQINEKEAKRIGERLKVNFDAFDLQEFRDALNVELSAELKEGEIHNHQDLSENELEAIGRVAMAHINPFED